MSSETYSITLDPDRLININEVEDFYNNNQVNLIVN